MKLERQEWTPLTIVIETPDEAEVLHKILGAITDDTEDRDGLYSLFMATGRGLQNPTKYNVTGTLKLTDNF